MGAVLSKFRALWRSGDDDADPSAAEDTDEMGAEQERVELRTEEQERELVRQMRAGFDEAGDAQAAALSDFWLLACLRSRKFDAARAGVLAANLARWRADLKLDGLGVLGGAGEGLRAQLRTGKFRLTGGRDKAGRAIFVLNLRHHDPSTYSAQDMVQLMAYTIERAHREGGALTQTRGFCFINDLSGVGMKNVDPRVPKAIFGALTSRLPGRLGQILIMNPPALFRVLFPIVSRLMKNKMRRRVRVVGSGDAARRALLQYIDADQLLPEHGGTLRFDLGR
eukprot:g6893.t1